MYTFCKVYSFFLRPMIKSWCCFLHVTDNHNWNYGIQGFRRKCVWVNSWLGFHRHNWKFFFGNRAPDNILMSVLLCCHSNILLLKFHVLLRIFNNFVRNVGTFITEWKISCVIFTLSLLLHLADYEDICSLKNVKQCKS